MTLTKIWAWPLGLIGKGYRLTTRLSWVQILSAVEFSTRPAALDISACIFWTWNLFLWLGGWLYAN